jgi:hypothetical protein
MYPGYIIFYITIYLIIYDIMDDIIKTVFINGILNQSCLNLLVKIIIFIVLRIDLFLLFFYKFIKIYKERNNDPYTYHNYLFLLKYSRYVRVIFVLRLFYIISIVIYRISDLLLTEYSEF